MEVELAANTAGLRGLTTRFSGSGRVEAIVFRPQRRAPAIYADEARIEPGRGLIGDHRAQRLSDTDERRKRELTLIQHEYLPLIAAWTSQGSVDALRLRRNLVISGLNLTAMHSPFPDLVLVWRLGPEICIEVTGTCPPCSRMEAELGVGGYNALRGHGGMTARVITGGVIRVGDAVHLERVDAARGSR
ncbi:MULTISPECIES: MOSC domain-containing protein [Gammaproteobacteria]|jgi:MOSC domain-containing protein YiiM|uniref:MOSC domain-containing protein n=1 Tax=Aquipseudomonas alcaligenes TaxID=43263 RepID=A0A5C7W1Y0_AQUAC|nr:MULTISPECIES: MOSC domain-containing protein [Pseudomonas aeruginosa group]HEE9763128.1 MOSC domain-containing protein [Pseudomonas putida]MDH1055997.1 MOSC domain-containing protein [Pseudomonas alcaligenes]MDH4665695.1 MOSC domain-containing protein [Pseudomonas aeruginosa]RTU27639.1 MOSC domain-containing protein [Pseudomonas aeruginosa]TXI31776.1 MAG: MOSC domain-containing protein [Pseudomonas alcaligenes]